MTMKHTFITEQRTLIDVLASMQPICTKRTTLDVTESILFQITPRELTLKATDLEISLQATTTIENSAEEGTSFLVSGKRIFDLVKELEGPIRFTATHSKLTLQSAGIDLSLNIKDAHDFPAFPERIENLIQLDASFLLTLLNKVAFLIPQNNANAALNGMLLEFTADRGMSLVTTDGHCLAHIITNTYTLNEEKKWLLPKRAVVELKKILEVTQVKNLFLGTCGNQLVFSGTNFNFFTKLIGDPFPQYEAVLARDGFVPASVAKEELVKTLKRTNCLLAGQFLSTEFTFNPGKVDVAFSNKEVGTLEETLKLQSFDGAAIASRFYSPYLLSGLQVFPEKDVRFFIKNNSRPIIFEAEQDSYCLTFLVMPVSAQQADQASGASDMARGRSA